jgi:putative transcriptional regulator
LTKTAFDKIAAGLRDAVAFEAGDDNAGVARVPPTIDVRAIRKAQGLSQDAFAQRFGFPPATVRDWEQGRRQPETSARILLRVIEREPEAVQRALAG